MTEDANATPLPSAFVEPWLADNESFVSELRVLSSRLAEQVPRLRQGLKGNGRIAVAQDVEPTSLSAVDAAVAAVELIDQVSILLQVVRVDDDGRTTLGQPQRVSGVNGHEMHMLTSPIRVAMECRELAGSTSTTIADNSYWSFLMEVNQAITRSETCDNPRLHGAVKSLLEEGLFIQMLESEDVIAMSKRGESDTLVPGISDRTVLEHVLTGGEFTKPVRLVDWVKGKFGVEKRGFNDAERKFVMEAYNDRIGVMFYKPHPWSRAYRIEGHLSRLSEEKWLMRLLSSIRKHTATRTIIEPWPQFMADFTAKHISAVASLYGQHNRHRVPLVVPTRS